LDDDLDHDEEIKYSAVCRDTDNSKFKTFSTVPSTMNHVDTLTKTGNTDCKDSLAHSSKMVMTLLYCTPYSIIKYSFKYMSPIYSFMLNSTCVGKTSRWNFHNNQYLCAAFYYGLGLIV
jgi:hypothetical protein